jgi:hypothetical protein
MSDFLESVERAAAAKFGNPSTAEEVQTAATVAKTISEANKAKVDAQNQLLQLQLERLKSWSVVLVPIVSLLTLLGTVIVQAVQLRQQFDASRSQSEDTEWRELLSSLRGPPKNYAADITVSSRLQAFMNSDRYKEQARRLAVRVMGNLTNASAFSELLSATAQIEGEDELKILLGIAKALADTKLSIESDCYNEALSIGVATETPYGVCTVTMSAPAAFELSRKTGDPKEALARRQSTLAVGTQINVVSALIGPILRARYLVGPDRAGSKTVDLTNLILNGIDLSGVDFSPFDLSNSTIWLSKLDGAILNPRVSGDLADSEWWNAASIEQNFLKWLIENRFPYFGPVVIGYPSGAVTREFYEARVRVLCTSRMAACNPPLPFSEPPPPNIQALDVAAPSRASDSAAPAGPAAKPKAATPDLDASASKSKAAPASKSKMRSQ